MRYKQWDVLIFIVAIAILFPQPQLLGQTKSEKEKKTEELFKMSLDEILNVKIKTAGKTDKKISDIPASVVLITREDIESYGYSTLIEVLENIPGLYGINNYEEDGANFGVRGFWSGVPNDNIIIMVNDVHQLNDLHSNYPLSKIAVPVEAIDRIEVVRGPMSVIYGSGAFYGAINIITNDYENTDSENIVSVTAGSAKTKKVIARFKSSDNDFKYVLNASLYDTYGIDQPLSEMVRNASSLANYLVPMDQRTGGRLENRKKYFSFSGDFKGLYCNLSYIEANKESYFLMPSVSKGHQNEISDTKISIGYKKQFSDKVSIDGRANYFHSTTMQRWNFLFEDFYGTERLESNAFEFDLNAFFHPSPKLDITTGIYYRAVSRVSDTFNLPSFGNPDFLNNYFYLPDGDEIVTRAFFAQVDYKPSSKLILVAGLRLEQMPKYSLESVLGGGTENHTAQSGFFDKDQIELIPRFAAIFKLNDDNIFKFLYGQAINRPSFFQTVSTIFDPDPERRNLDPESIQTMEFNYIASFSSRFSLNVSVFRNTLENLITRVVVFDEDNNYETWSANAKKMITNGVGLTLQMEPFDNFRLELSGTYQETKDKRDGYEDRTVAYSPKFLGYLKASFHSGKLIISATGNYVGAMETFWDGTVVNADGSHGIRIGDEVDGHFMLNANLRIEDLFLDGFYLNIRCSNLLDAEIRYPTVPNNQWADRGTLGMGRSFLVSLGYEF